MMYIVFLCFTFLIGMYLCFILFKNKGINHFNGFDRYIQFAVIGIIISRVLYVIINFNKFIVNSFDLHISRTVVNNVTFQTENLYFTTFPYTLFTVNKIGLSTLGFTALFLCLILYKGYLRKNWQVVLEYFYVYMSLSLTTIMFEFMLSRVYGIGTDQLVVSVVVNLFIAIISYIILRKVDLNVEGAIIRGENFDPLKNRVKNLATFAKKRNFSKFIDQLKQYESRY